MGATNPLIPEKYPYLGVTGMSVGNATIVSLDSFIFLKKIICEFSNSFT